MSETNNKKTPQKKKKMTCGIVMPISSIDNCSAEHWTEVLTILKEVIKEADFEPNLVSDADDSGIIQKRIIQNLYKNEIVVCDVSAKNPNVMFELGMRLAFDKPTIIIKDDKTDYSFDTSVIEHVSYPRDLRFTKILKFKETLKSKIVSTYEKSVSDPNYTTFLKHFGEYKITQLEQKEISSEKYLLSAMEDIKHSIRELRLNQNRDSNRFIHSNESHFDNTSTSIIRSRINQFRKEKKIKSDYQIIRDKREGELFDYLEDFEDIRNICEGPDELKKRIDNMLVPF